LTLDWKHTEIKKFLLITAHSLATACIGFGFSNGLSESSSFGVWHWRSEDGSDEGKSNDDSGETHCVFVVGLGVCFEACVEFGSRLFGLEEAWSVVCLT
jgi:hypothetical protein